ncbi:LysR substrate-binding domain-containing protein [Paraburkholderia fynbosensis]|uniref:Glycine cleavage system transcriptional activator n=1 Tax=Paraburkholderia fynbosensis TaxID=1200993 RepID=A0A6J5H4I1_9BURK|nr:LysR substrate-binding domain-containing protein [Paraburkholderia fynbosensis]CAB3810456.1 Glycine cleavage system transcriptional activator [Paraburkholderia fynbosensis]
MKKTIGRTIPSSDALTIFDACVRRMNFTQAGDALGLTQSAVSRQIKDLEEFLNVSLFERSGRHLTLTDSGRDYWEKVVPLLDELEAVTVRIQMRHTLRNSLDLSVAGSFCNRWLIPNLPDFLKENPGILVNVTSRVGPIDLTRSQFDAAIINSPTQPAGTTTAKLFPLTLAAYGAPGLLPGAGKLDAETIASLPLLHLKEMPDAWSDYLAGMGLPNLKVTAASFYSLLLLSCEAALAGLGIALLPPEFVGEDVKAGRLVRLSQHSIQTKYSYWLAWQSTQAESEALLAFRRWLEARCG